MEIETVRKHTDKKLRELESASRQCRMMGKETRKAQSHLDALYEAQELVQSVAQQVQQRAHSRIADVVTRSLEAVFDEPYTFRIHFERKRGQTEARLAFERDSVEIDPMSAAGGGVVDVAAFALQLSCLVLSKPQTRQTLILDEPFKYVSEEYRSRIRSLLEMLAEEMKVQILMVTHIDALKMGKTIQLEA